MQKRRNVQQTICNSVRVFADEDVIKLHNMLVKIYNRHSGTLPNPKSIASLLLGVGVKIMIENTVRLRDEERSVIVQDGNNTMQSWDLNKKSIDENKNLRSHITKRLDTTVIVMNQDDVNVVNNSDNGPVANITTILTLEEVMFLSQFAKGKSAFVLYMFNGSRFSRYVHPVYNILAQSVPTITLSNVIDSVINIDHPYYKLRYRKTIAYQDFILHEPTHRKLDIVIIAQGNERKADIERYRSKGWKIAQTAQKAFFWTLAGLTYGGRQIYFITKVSPSMYEAACVEYNLYKSVRGFGIHPNFFLLLNSIREISIKPIVSQLTRSRVTFVTNRIPVTVSERTLGEFSMINWVEEVVKIIQKKVNHKHSFLTLVADKASGKTTCTKYLTMKLNSMAPGSTNWGRVDSDAYGKWITLKKRGSMNVNIFNSWLDLITLQDNDTIPSMFAVEMKALLVANSLQMYGIDPRKEIEVQEKFRLIAFRYITDTDLGLETFYDEILNQPDAPIGIILETHTNFELSKMPGTSYIVTLDCPYDTEAAVAERLRSESDIMTELMLFRAWRRFRVQTYPSICTTMFFDDSLLLAANYQDEDSTLEG